MEQDRRISPVSLRDSPPPCLSYHTRNLFILVDGLQRKFPALHGDEKPEARAAARRERPCLRGQLHRHKVYKTTQHQGGGERSLPFIQLELVVLTLVEINHLIPSLVGTLFVSNLVR